MVIVLFFVCHPVTNALEHEVFVEGYGQVFKIKCILLCKQVSMWENHGNKLIVMEFQDTQNSKEISQEIPSPEMIWVSWVEIHSISYLSFEIKCPHL